MTLLAVLITLATGAVMGAVNNLAGGAGALGLLAFEYACGLPIATANPSMRLAALSIGIFAYLGYARAGQRVPRRVWILGALALPGAPLGSWLALHVPPLAFWTYLSLVLLALILQQVRRPALAPGPARPFWQAMIACFLIGMHMGYAQVGMGLLTTLVLAATYDRDLVATAAAKSVIVIVTSAASLATFSAAEAISWGPALWLSLGTGIGSFWISRWAVSRGTRAVRIVVLAVAGFTLAYAVRHAILAAGA
ncbi:MAG: hypothetical protein Fur0037_13350 [Planctomycetota bacterium]